MLYCLSSILIKVTSCRATFLVAGLLLASIGCGETQDATSSGTASTQPVQPAVVAPSTGGAPIAPQASRATKAQHVASVVPETNNVWTPSDDLLSQLGNSVKVGDYSLRVPNGSNDYPPPSSLPPGATARVWAGPVSKERSFSSFMLLELNVPAGTVLAPLDAMLNKSMTPYQRRFVNVTQTAMEIGKVGGLTFGRLYWSAQDPKLSNRRVHGFVYSAYDGPTRMIQFFFQDFEPHHETSLKPFESAVLTLRRAGDTALAIPSGGDQPPGSQPVAGWDELFAQQDFKLASSGMLRFAKQAGGMLVFTNDGAMPTKSPEDPVFVIGYAKADPTVSDPREFAEQRVQQISRAKNVQVQNSQMAMVDKLTGIELQASGLDTKTGSPLALYQLILGDQNSYLLVQAVVGSPQADKYMPEFKRLAHSFQRKR